jgi:hypothetical protein
VTYLLFSALSWLSSLALAQGKCPDLPETYAWTTAQAYQKDADLVKRTLKWLTNAPMNMDLATRSEANIFVLTWISGAPDLRVEIETENLPFIVSHPELLDSFIHGVALAQMQKEKPLTEVEKYCAGFQSVAQVASWSKSLCKCRQLRALMRAYKKNKVKEYTEKWLAKTVDKIERDEHQGQ